MTTTLPIRRVRRGIKAGLLGALIGAALPPLIIAMADTISWWITGEVARQDEMNDWWMGAVGRSTCLAIYVGLAAWATYTPARYYGVVPTFVILVFNAFPVTLIIDTFELTPRRFKAIEHSELYPSEVLVLLLPPLFIASALIAVRCYGSEETSAAPA